MRAFAWLLLLLLLAAVPADAGPLTEPGPLPAWIAATGLSRDGQGVLYSRRHPRTLALATLRLTPEQAAKLDAFLDRVPAQDPEPAFSDALIAALNGIRPADTIWFRPTERGLVLTERGREAVPGAVLGDPHGLAFEYPEGPEPGPFDGPIRLSPWLPLPGPKKGLERASEEREAAFDGFKPSAVYSIEAAPAAFDPDESFLAAVTPAAKEPRWYAMERTRSQWERWQRKAEQWRDDAELRRAYDDDVSEYSGGFGSAQAIAVADVIVVRIQETWPNVVTDFLVSAGLAFDHVTRKLPVRFRDDLSDELRRRLGRDRSKPEERAELLRNADLDAGGGELSLAGDPFGDAPGRRHPTVWERLDPKLSFRVSPRVKLDDLSAKLGAKLKFKWGEHVRFQLGAEYDTKDEDWFCVGSVCVSW